MTTTKLDGTRLTSISNAEDAGSAIKSAGTVLHNFRNGEAEREAMKEALSAMPEKTRKIFLARLNDSESDIHALRIATARTYFGILGGVMKSLEAFSKEQILAMDDVQCADVQRATTELYNKFPQAFPLKAKSN
jgi:hypothetical protein